MDGQPRFTIHQLLKVMIDRGASDLHVTTGSPPQLRIDGSLVPLKTPPLDPIETKQLCYSVISEEQFLYSLQQRLIAEGVVVNFAQRQSVLPQIRPFAGLGPPE